jgi:epsilon-lactone hydrolase
MADKDTSRPPSIRSRLLTWFLKRTVKRQKLTRGDLPAIRRELIHKARSKLPKGVSALPVSGVVRGEWLTTIAPARGKAVLYFHGGGYVVGAPVTHRPITGRLADLLNTKVFALDYRLAPENPCPAAIQDAIKCWEWLLTQGYRPGNILLAGDSAGGGLVLALMQAIARSGGQQAGLALLFSPWTDLTGTVPSVHENAENCAWFTPEQLGFIADQYRGNQSAESPTVSPLHGDMAGLPPIILYASDSEILRDDTVLLAEKIRAGGGSAEIEVWHGLPHAWPLFAGLIPEADRCLKEAAAKILGS